jgi:hypothetical protein
MGPVWPVPVQSRASGSGLYRAKSRWAPAGRRVLLFSRRTPPPQPTLWKDFQGCWIAMFAHLSATAAFGWFDPTAISPVRPMMRRLSPITWKACFLPEPTRMHCFRSPAPLRERAITSSRVSTESRGRLRAEVPAPENRVRRRWPEVQKAWERGQQLFRQTSHGRKRRLLPFSVIWSANRQCAMLLDS